jgi:POT family proton-dependent oligopeptide transporter
VAAADPALRTALDELLVMSDTRRVSPWWLVGFFLLGTLGEMCLLPVGMSMVSQFAPARFATMFMGLWLLTFAFGNYLAGAVGEQWGTWPPTQYFFVLLGVLAGAASLMFALAGKVRRMMHE